MSGQIARRSPSASTPTDAHSQTVLLHGRRFKALRREAYPYDILIDGNGGDHVATVHGEPGDATDENAACLAASAQMLSALVDIMNAHCRGYDLPWGTVQAAILAGFGAPEIGERFTSLRTEHDGRRDKPAGTTWVVTGLGYCGSRRVLVRLSGPGAREIERSLDELRLSFRPVEA